MIILKGSNKKGWIMKFTKWESWPGAEDGREWAITGSEMKAIYKLLKRHYKGKSMQNSQTYANVDKTNNNPEEIIKWCNREIEEYQKLINTIRMDEINAYRKKCKLPKYKAGYCLICSQITNHQGPYCMKCKSIAHIEPDDNQMGHGGGQ